MTGVLLSRGSVSVSASGVLAKLHAGTFWKSELFISTFTRGSCHLAQPHQLGQKQKRHSVKQAR